MGRDRKPNVVILECFVCRWEGSEGEDGRVLRWEGGKGGRLVKWEGGKGGRVVR